MERYPLAIYTAEQGLAWAYDRTAISFAALDACRKAFGALPDFDAGEPGFEGVWATAERVFVVRCQSAPAWDFRGRDATYLAVTWVPRTQAASTNFEALLASPFLCQPMHTPPADFLASATCPTALPCPASALLPEGFAGAGAIIAGLPPGATATFRRALGERAVHVRVNLPTSPNREDAYARLSGLPHPAPCADAPQSLPPCGLLLPWPVAIVAAVIFLLSLILSGWLSYDKWLKPIFQPQPQTPPVVSPCEDPLLLWKQWMEPLETTPTYILFIEPKQGVHP